MAANVDAGVRGILHPVHAFLLAGNATLLIAALLADLAYASSHEIQWSNFASWLIAGALVLGLFALAWAIVAVLRRRRTGGGGALHLLVVLATWIIGFVNALVHARDAWAVMPTGVALSAIVAVLACLAYGSGHANAGTGEAP